MKKIGNCILFFSLLMISSNAFATNGCYISSTGIIYTSPIGGSGKYNTSPSENIGVGACLNGASGGSCTVNSVPGNKGDYSIWYCPIDDYVWALIAGSSVFAIGVIRKRTNRDLLAE